MAEHHDRMEIAARRDGAFDAAVDHQYFAACYRAGMDPPSTHGSPAKSLSIELSNELIVTRGDLRNAADLRTVARELLEMADERDPEGAELPPGAIDAIHAMQDSMQELLRVWGKSGG